MASIPAAQVAKEVKNQGGSDQQAWVAAALVSGIESNGDPTDKNPSSTACGLFQFLTTTWASNGGAKYAPTACQATWQQQVSVFLTASQGNNFYPWAPDLGGSYNGTPIYGPKSGSAVANKISQLSATGALGFLGNVPQSWIGNVGGAGAVTPTSGLGSLIPGGGSTSTNNCSPVISGVGVTVLNSCQANEILGGLLMGVGGLLLVVGLGLVFADLGLRKAAPTIVSAVIGDRLGKRSAQTSSDRRVAEQTQIAEARASARRSTQQPRQPTAAQRARWRDEGFPGDQ